MDSLNACATDDRDAFNAGLKGVVDALTKVNTVMNEMWTKSKPQSYTSFRTFIFGITSQTMFPNGVL
jgi:indoleamine 2,3-dioxygenase